VYTQGMYGGYTYQGYTGRHIEEGYHLPGYTGRHIEGGIPHQGA